MIFSPSGVNILPTLRLSAEYKLSKATDATTWHRGQFGRSRHKEVDTPRK